jgi:hypothetical protein
VRRDPEISRAQQLPDDRDRRHAGRGDHGVRAAFGVGDGFGEMVARGVAAARVVVAAAGARRVEDEVGGQVERRYDRPMLTI